MLLFGALSYSPFSGTLKIEPNVFKRESESNFDVEKVDVGLESINRAYGTSRLQ